MNFITTKIAKDEDFRQERYSRGETHTKNNARYQ